MRSAAYHVSSQLLARDDFRAACAARDFGALFRLMRKYDGASQDRICSPVEGLTQSRVSRIMRGDDRVASLDLIERIIDALGIPGGYVGLASRDWEPDSSALAATVTAIRPRVAGGLAPVTPPRETVVPAPADNEEGFAPCSPTYVGRPVGLRPHVERAFTEDVVTIDFAGYSGETLAGCLTEPLDKVRTGRLAPSSIRIRVLVLDTSRPWVLPCRMENLADESAFRERMASIGDRSLTTIMDSVAELRDMDIVPDAAAEIRVHGLSPLFKLYLINNREAFFGFYPVMEFTVRSPGRALHMYNLMGKDSILFHHSSDDTDHTSAAAQYVAHARHWFDSVWTTVSQDCTRK